MKGSRISAVTVLLLGLLMLPCLSWAATATATASVSATIPLTVTVTLKRDTNSVTRGTTSQILFDKRDDQDTGAPSPRNAAFMYAPYRSETNKNWHIADVIANGSSMNLTASVSGTVSTTPLANILRVWCGGFFTPGASTPIQGTATQDDGNANTDDWEYLNGFSRSLTKPFIGVVPFNYRLDIASIPAGGSFTGTITFTLTST